MNSRLPLLPALGLFLALAACDHGLAPPDEPQFGAVDVRVSYEGPWPPADSLFDLRFVAFRFVPQDTADFFRLTELVFSDRLQYNVDSERVFVDELAAGTFPYSGIAQRFSANILDWRPVGLYEEDGGLFTVAAAETTRIEIRVNFLDLPPFPPTPQDRLP